MKKTYQYQIVSEVRQPAGHMMYCLKHKAKNGAISEFWIGANKLKRYYEQDRITGIMGNTIRAVVGKDPRRKKMNKKEEKELIEQQAKEINAATEWTIPDEFVVKPLIKQASCYEKDGRWHVVMLDGQEDEDSYGDKEIAESYVDSLNEGVDN